MRTTLQNASVTTLCLRVISTLKISVRRKIIVDPVISGNDVFSHASVGASDFDASCKFYDAALGALGIKNLGPFGDTIMLYGKDKPALLVLKPGAYAGYLRDQAIPRPSLHHQLNVAGEPEYYCHRIRIDPYNHLIQARSS